MKKKILVFLVAILVSCSGFVYAVNEKTEKEVTSIGLISIDFQGTTLYTVLNVLSMKTGMRLITDTTLYDKKIMLSLKDVTAEEALNALLDTYDLYYVKQGDANIYVIKSKADGSHITVSRVIFCNYAKASDLEKILETRLSKGGKIVSDIRTNSVIITDLADSIDKMESLIRSLDVPTQQVMLEAKIVDVNLSSGLSLGTKWNETYRNGLVNPVSGLNNFTYSTPMGTAAGLGLNKSFGKIGVSILEGDWNINAIIEAGIEDKNAKVLSNPKLLVLNNQEATIDIVEEVPYLESKTTSASTGDTSGTTAFKQVGIKLKVKPQINRDGSIVLSVSPEQSYRTGETIGTDNTPVINTSKTTTTLMLRSGETAAIGGLIRESEDSTINKVPLLGDIPIIGYLFKGYTKNKTRYELTIFITAKIVN
ncbi:MAG: secretin N-terminal domain-containing protein [Endomicrobiia bacterium]|nr:secretin N-terminal domain-containing protein [Endomicrobiaceae bacterium]MDD3922422.1 secretin N-terminal domain-containing protein [Endomicrobiaceae bacterium]